MESWDALDGSEVAFHIIKISWIQQLNLIEKL